MCCVLMSLGGRYSGEMKINECTHLVLTEAKGSSFHSVFARHKF